MEDIFYRFLQGIKKNYLPLNDNEKRFVIYALGHASIYKSELRCGFPVKDVFYFLCNGVKNTAELSKKIDDVFKAFYVVLSHDGKIRHINLLNSVTFDLENILLVFNLHQIELWLLQKENELEKSLEEWIKEEVNNLVQGVSESSIDSKEDLSNEPIYDGYLELSTESPLTLTIEELDLSVRGYNCLKRIGVNTVEDLIEKTELELLREAKVGAKSLADILYKLHSLGLALKRDDTPPF